MKYRSLMFSELSGSMGGMVASRNGSGQYLRARRTPVNPNSDAQTEVRMAFAAAVLAWNSLSSGVRAGWEAYAAETPVPDAIGETIRQTGRAWYIAQHSFLARIGATPATNAPVTPGLISLGEPLLFKLSVADDIEVEFDNTLPAGHLLMQIGPAVGPTVNFFKAPYTFGATVASFEFANTPLVDNRYGPLVALTRRPTRFRYCTNTGKLSNVYEVIADVSAT